MSTYTVSIKEASEQLTAKQRISLKDTTSALKLDEVTQAENVQIFPVLYAVLNIHNDKSDNPDYENYIVVDKSGKKYVTGSASFWDSFMNIASEMEGENEDWGIEVYRIPSKNYKGKEFITCKII